VQRFATGVCGMAHVIIRRVRIDLEKVRFEQRREVGKRVI
jgi:hypothetical protein